MYTKNDFPVGSKAMVIATVDVGEGKTGVIIDNPEPPESHLFGYMCLQFDDGSGYYFGKIKDFEPVFEYGDDVEVSDDGSARNGQYRITPRGMMFVEGKCTATQKFIMDGGRFRGFDGEQITFSQAIGSKFNFNELMQR